MLIIVQKRMSERKPSPEEKVARHLRRLCYLYCEFWHKINVKLTGSFAVP